MDFIRQRITALGVEEAGRRYFTALRAPDDDGDRWIVEAVWRGVGIDAETHLLLVLAAVEVAEDNVDLWLLGDGGCAHLIWPHPLPVSSRWYAGSWFVPVVNLFAPYRPTKLSWEGTTRSGPPRWLPWWWTVWVLATVRTVFFSTHPVESGWQALDAPYRIYNATTALLLGLLTVAVLNRLAREQRAAAADRSVPAS